MAIMNLETLWESINFTPNPQQREAITHVDGPLYITAGPGSGKTRVLLWRTLNLIVFHGVLPEEIFLSTFTEKAAHQLREGLRGLLDRVTNITGQPYDLSTMYIGTVHSLCRRILNDRRRFLQDYHQSPTPTLLDELGQYFHIAKSKTWQKLSETIPTTDEEEKDLSATIKDLFTLQSASKHTAVSNLMAFFNRCSEEHINPQEAILKIQEILATQTGESEKPLVDLESLTIAFQLYNTYTESLKRTEQLRYTDFSLLQQEAYRVLLKRDETKNVFKHIIIDEYQDTNTIQEKIFFHLAKGSNNICVVGDDDQALYRFRGATVENFVDFPARCLEYLGQDPKRISLDINYRSRKEIVDFYSKFIKECSWERKDGGFYRVMDKNIIAHSQDDNLSVIASTPGNPEDVCEEIAELVKKLIDSGKVEDPNQIAFLFPSLKSVAVDRMCNALEEHKLKVYAPRAGTFLDVDESVDVFGLIAFVFGLPTIERGRGRELEDFINWMHLCVENAKQLTKSDPVLKAFITDKQSEIAQARSDYEAFIKVIKRESWNLKGPYQLSLMKRKLYSAPGLSETAKKLISSSYFDNTVNKRAREGNPISLDYVIKRATSLDWSLLDFFYRLCTFSHFKNMFDLAERGEDEGPICNLSLITEYLARFVDDFVPVITADLLVDELFHRIFYFSFLYPIYQLKESEYEDADDPFPKGRIPFLTIHQAKGLEFPVVVLGNLYRRSFPPSFTEKAVRLFTEKPSSEPLNQHAEFDRMRMFYVALSRAQNLLVLAHYKGRGQSLSPPFQKFLDEDFPRIPELSLETVPAYTSRTSDLPTLYSYTSDYLNYIKCPRQYMIFNKFEFVPSRTQTMFFGSLIHRTLEDLHHEIIRRRKEANDAS